MEIPRNDPSSSQRYVGLCLWPSDPIESDSRSAYKLLRIALPPGHIGAHLSPARKWHAHFGRTKTTTAQDSLGESGSTGNKTDSSDTRFARASRPAFQNRFPREPAL